MAPKVTDEGREGKYFTLLVNMADDDLDPYQYRLFGHYKRVCGESLDGACWESTRTTAEKCRMSVGKVASTRRELVELGYIEITAGTADQTLAITLKDLMHQNVQRFAERSPHEQPVHEVNATVHEVKQRRTKEEELIEESKTNTSIPKEGIDVLPPPAKPQTTRRPSPHEPEYLELLKADNLKRQQMTRSADTAYWQVASELHASRFPLERIGELAVYVQRRARGENWKSRTVYTYGKYAPDFLRDCPRVVLLPDELPPKATESPPRAQISEGQRQQAEQVLAGVTNKLGGRREQQPAKA